MSDIRTRRTLRGGLATLAVGAALIAVPAAAGAATFTVNTTTDNAPGAGECAGLTGDCSLRQAIDAANVAGGANTIVVPAGTYDLTIPANGEDEDDSGDLNVTDPQLTITGAGARHTTIDASAIEDRVIGSPEGEDLTLSGLTVTGGYTPENGGGIAVEEGSLTLRGVTVTKNVAYDSSDGGGVYVGDGTTVSIVDSTISHNMNSGDGGGLETYTETLAIENSTIADNVVNTALFPANEGWGAYGGGMEADGETLVLKNSTFSGNEVIDGNGGEEGRGAAMDASFENLEVVNTIIADNTGTEVDEYGQCTHTLESLGHNLESAEPEGELRCFEGSTDLIADPLLSALANNGGETDTVAIAANSPAVDAGDATLCLPTDQRGYARPVGGGCDIGAYEYGAGPAPTTVTPTPMAAATTAPVGGWFGIKKIERNSKQGTLKLGVKFHTAGTVTVSGKGLAKVTKKVAAGLGYVTLRPIGALKTKLAQAGSAKVKVTVSFDNAVNTYAKQRAVTFRLKR